MATRNDITQEEFLNKVFQLPIDADTIRGAIEEVVSCAEAGAENSFYEGNVSFSFTEEISDNGQITYSMRNEGGYDSITIEKSDSDVSARMETNYVNYCTSSFRFEIVPDGMRIERYDTIEGNSTDDRIETVSYNAEGEKTVLSSEHTSYENGYMTVTEIVDNGVATTVEYAPYTYEGTENPQIDRTIAIDGETTTTTEFSYSYDYPNELVGFKETVTNPDQRVEIETYKNTEGLTEIKVTHFGEDGRPADVEVLTEKDTLSSTPERESHVTFTEGDKLYEVSSSTKEDTKLTITSYEGSDKIVQEYEVQGDNIQLTRVEISTETENGFIPIHDYEVEQGEDGRYTLTENGISVELSEQELSQYGIDATPELSEKAAEAIERAEANVESPIDVEGIKDAALEGQPEGRDRFVIETDIPELSPDHDSGKVPELAPDHDSGEVRELYPDIEPDRIPELLPDLPDDRIPEMPPCCNDDDIKPLEETEFDKTEDNYYPEELNDE